jgi:hypothetical protein
VITLVRFTENTEKAQRTQSTIVEDSC